MQAPFDTQLLRQWPSCKALPSTYGNFAPAAAVNSFARSGSRADAVLPLQSPYLGSIVPMRAHPT